MIAYMYDIKPLKKPVSQPMLQSVQGISLTYAAAEMMVSNAQVVSEGLVEKTEDQSQYRGSTLVSIDLNKPCFDIQKDEQTLVCLLRAAERSLFLHIRLMRLARLEAERRAAPLFVREMQAESVFRLVDKHLLVDIDIDCPLAARLGESKPALSGGRS
jgi:hypothetical protein